MLVGSGGMPLPLENMEMGELNVAFSCDLELYVTVLFQVKS